VSPPPEEEEAEEAEEVPLRMEEYQPLDLTEEEAL
jgi:hypothetical protein